MQSYLEDYYKDDGESILTLDESLRKLLNGNTAGNDFRAAEDDYHSNIPPDTRNGNNILEMDIGIFNLQKRLKKLEDDTDKLEDNDYDETLLLLIKQMQCELPQLETPGLSMDCRVAGCEYEYGHNNILCVFFFFCLFIII